MNHEAARIFSKLIFSYCDVRGIDYTALLRGESDSLLKKKETLMIRKTGRYSVL